MKSIYSPAYQALIAWLRLQRTARGLTLRAVGARVHLPHTWVNKVEAGERRLDVMEYVRLCHALDVEPGQGIAVIEAALGSYKPAAPANLKAADGRAPYPAGRRRHSRS